MGYQKGGTPKNKKMMGGGMMGYSAGGSIETIKMPQEVATPKLGQTLEIPVKGHKNYKGTVKFRKEDNMKLLKDVIGWLKEWNDWNMKDWIKAGVLCVIVLAVLGAI